MVDLLTPLALIFIASVPPLIVAKYFDIPSVPIYILVGLVIAPFIGRDQTLGLAQFGIAFLVFTFGVYVEPERIGAVARDSEHVAAIQLLVIGAVGTGLGLGLGFNALNAVYLGIAAALSSSLIGRELLDEDLYLDLVHSRLTQSVHFIQDLFAVVFVLLLSATVFELDAIALNLGYGVILLVSAILVRVYLFDYLVKLSAGSDELIGLTGIGLLVCFIAGAELFGISIVVGAFAAGLAVRLDFADNLALLNGLESLEDFFAAIFFVTLGSLVTTPTLETGLIVIGLLGCIVLLKPLITIYVLVRYGYETRTASLTSFSLDQVSEFSLIIAIQALILGRIDDVVFDAIVLVAAVTMITSTVTRHYDERLYRWLANRQVFESTHERIRSRSTVTSPLSDHLIVIGYGRIGRQIARACDRFEQPYVVIEHDPERFEAANDECENVVFGDAVTAITMEVANAKAAATIISTSPDRRIATALLSDPAHGHVDVFLRAQTADQAIGFYEDGADYVIVPDYLAATALERTIRDVFEGTVTPKQLRQTELSSLRRAEQTSIQTN
jgi:CPA2 family monovalent cation:H+ antiporter-2